MKRKNTIIISTIIILLLAGGWLWYGKMEKTMKSQDITTENSAVSIPQPKNNQSGIAIPPINASPQAQENLAWYDIPELGIRFKMTPLEREQLVYYKDPSLRAVRFSTRILESLSKYCSAKEGSPLGGISRVYGTPSDPIAPCGGGFRVKNFPGGYFCYTQAQSSCLSKEQEEQNKEVLDKTLGADIFRVQKFWDSAEIYK
jgi:hypothetical protein